MKLPQTALLSVIGLALVAAVVLAADHFDSPITRYDVRTDITDVYAFRSPADANNLVVALNVTSFSHGAAPLPLFSNDASYNIHVDLTGDYIPNATVTFTFSGISPQQFTASGLGADITGEVTGSGAAPNVVTSGAIKVFCGPRDDPFFFDLDGFKKFVSGPYVPTAGLRDAALGTPADFFAGRNVASIVVELPIVALTGESNSNTGKIYAWSSITQPESK
ncbi:MAG TPA: DUF4331 family protein [candidate division Zixibacteria bacterium]|nr:DUF4331 family protein [candidate division Zixibacteria bacterium]